MTTNLITAFEQVFKVTADLTQPTPDDGGFVGPELDLFVSESDARHMQQRVDNWLTREPT